MAKKSGLKLSIHAGEAGGEANIYEAVEQFHAERIGHGIRAADDEALMEMLKKKNILLEICLTSNLQTGVVSDVKNHPIRRLMEYGVPVNLNTDDPAISGITLTDEYIKAVQELNFTGEDLKTQNRTAIDHAFYPDKDWLRKRLSRLWD